MNGKYLGERKPRWLRTSLVGGGRLPLVNRLVREMDLATVCRSARCPNRSSCYARGTATFLILGERCTRSCPFCAVESASPPPPDPAEPERVAEAAAGLELKHVVITSVTRDDLDDGGAGQFAAVIRAVRRRLPGTAVEVLIPDFGGDGEALAMVLSATPDVLNHNLETVPRLYPRVRPGADYRRSLELLSSAGALAPGILIKSGLMVGLGEQEAEVYTVLEDLRRIGCQVVTIGQYLRPSLAHLPVTEYVPPGRFAAYRRAGREMGFRSVVAGPLVRSSFRAAEVYRLAVRS